MKTGVTMRGDGGMVGAQGYEAWWDSVQQIWKQKVLVKEKE